MTGNKWIYFFCACFSLSYRHVFGIIFLLSFLDSSPFHLSPPPSQLIATLEINLQINIKVDFMEILPALVRAFFCLALPVEFSKLRNGRREPEDGMWLLWIAFALVGGAHLEEMMEFSWLLTQGISMNVASLIITVQTEERKFPSFLPLGISQVLLKTLFLSNVWLKLQSRMEEQSLKFLKDFFGLLQSWLK